MKKYTLLALLFSALSTVTFILSLIFLDPVTTIIVWWITMITSSASLACFLTAYLSNPPTTVLEKIKEKLIRIKEEPYTAAKGSVVYKNRHKGKIEGITIALEIINEYTDPKNQQ